MSAAPQLGGADVTEGSPCYRSASWMVGAKGACLALLREMKLVSFPLSVIGDRAGCATVASASALIFRNFRSRLSIASLFRLGSVSSATSQAPNSYRHAVGLWAAMPSGFNTAEIYLERL